MTEIMFRQPVLVEYIHHTALGGYVGQGNIYRRQSRFFRDSWDDAVLDCRCLCEYGASDSFDLWGENGGVRIFLGRHMDGACVAADIVGAVELKERQERAER